MNEFNIEELVNKYTSYLNSIINKIAGTSLNYEDKEEIIADTFFIIWKKQDENITDIKAYMTGITKNLILEKFKKRKIEYDISDYENTLDFSTGEIFSKERTEIEKVENKLRSLNNLDYKIVTMYYYSSKSIKEIALELDMSESSVKTRLFRIRKKIKKELGVGD